MTQLLGYQLRTPIGELAHLWPKDRRDDYLLRPEIVGALSADPSVWPWAERPQLAAKLFVDYSAEPFESPNGLKLYLLRKGALQALRESGDQALLVGLAADDRDAEGLRAKHFSQQPSAATGAEEGFLELRGVDVCDEWLASGLMNCRVSAANQEMLRTQFGASINPAGLFSNQQVAVAFAEKLNGLVPEHAPFMPFHVYVARAASS